ncbi:MAG: InlB B-repeat-containing protein [Clostridia bacterium]|nr:InlB B-repeat-containing protein [Clostridia bacterium]
MPFFPCRCEPCPPPPPPPPVIQFSVTYLSNGGTGGTVDTGVASGTQYVAKNDAAVGISRPDYGFVGWNTMPDGSGTAYVPGQVITIAANLTLYAQWAAQLPMFDVTYDANGGTGGTVDAGIASGARYVIKNDAAAGISRPDYDFVGWNTMPDGSGVAYMPGQVITVVGNLTLYAQWTAQLPMLDVTYDANGGTGGTVDTSIPSGTRYVVKSNTAMGVNRPNYDFVGWNTMANGSGTAYMPGQVITITNNLTLYAQWAAQLPTYSVTYHGGIGGTGGMVDAGLALDSQYVIRNGQAAGVSNPSHAFLVWNTRQDGLGVTYVAGQVITITDNLTLYAQWIWLG